MIVAVPMPRMVMPMRVIMIMTGTRIQRGGRLEGLKLLPLSDKPEAIENHQERSSDMHERGYDWIDNLERSECKSSNHEKNAKQEILIDHRPGLTGKLDEEGKPAEIAVHQRNGRAVDRHFAPGRAHRNAEIPCCERRLRDASPSARHERSEEHTESGQATDSAQHAG